LSVGLGAGPDTVTDIAVGGDQAVDRSRGDERRFHGGEGADLAFDVHVYGRARRVIGHLQFRLVRGGDTGRRRGRDRRVVATGDRIDVRLRDVRQVALRHRHRRARRRHRHARRAR